MLMVLCEIMTEIVDEAYLLFAGIGVDGWVVVDMVVCRF